MSHSYAQIAPAACPACGHRFKADVWLIRDTRALAGGHP
jgi:hypothetical protein